jgi:hypothetical protein
MVRNTLTSGLFLFVLIVLNETHAHSAVPTVTWTKGFPDVINGGKNKMGMPLPGKIKSQGKQTAPGVAAPDPVYNFNYANTVVSPANGGQGYVATMFHLNGDLGAPGNAGVVGPLEMGGIAQGTYDVQIVCFYWYASNEGVGGAQFFAPKVNKVVN